MTSNSYKVTSVPVSGATALHFAGTQRHGKRELQETLSADSVLRKKAGHYGYALRTITDPQRYPDASPIQTLAPDQPRHHKLP